MSMFLLYKNSVLQDRTKSTQKRTSTVSTPQTRSKRSKKESKNDNENQQPPPDGTVVYQIPVTISSGRPSPASTPVSDKSVVSTISPEEASENFILLRKSTCVRVNNT